jgi:hypothetical protein
MTMPVLSWIPGEPVPSAEVNPAVPAPLSAIWTAPAMLEAARADRDHADPVLAAVDEALPEPLGAMLAASTLRWDRPGTLAALFDRPIGPAYAIAEVAWALARHLGDGGPFAGIPTGYAPPVFADTADPADVLPQATAAAERDDLAAGAAGVVLTRPAALVPDGRRPGAGCCAVSGPTHTPTSPTSPTASTRPLSSAAQLPQNTA